MSVLSPATIQELNRIMSSVPGKGFGDILEEALAAAISDIDQLEAGTGAGNLVQLNESAQLPAVDGSLLTDVHAETADTASTAVATEGIGAIDAPASATAEGTAGQIAYDATHIYLCIAADTWVRADLATWGA